MAQLSFNDIRVDGNPPSQVRVVFSLRDEEGHSIVLPPDELEAAVRIFELGPGTRDWQELDYAETTFFVQSGESFELEVVFVLDFTRSIGRDGVQVMLDAFERTLNALEGPNRIGVVEFHDRSTGPGIISPLTTDRQAILKSVDEFATSRFEPGSSRLWDSIQTAASLFTSRQGSPGVVRTMVLISDGRDTSSILTAPEAAAIAAQERIGLYAVGVGEALGTTDLEELVTSLEGAYYRPAQIDELQDRLRTLESDLRGQYLLGYTTLRRQGLYRTRVEVDLPGATGAFETAELDVGAIYGSVVSGTLSVDSTSLDRQERAAQVLIRALFVPRNVSRFRFRLDTVKPVDVRLVSKSEGGLLEGWELAGPGPDGYFLASGSQPLDFSSSGLLFHLTLSDVTEGRLRVPLEFDNSIYAGPQSFTYPHIIRFGPPIFPPGRIVFRSNRDGDSEIYIMNGDGTGQKNLTNNPASDLYPALSPDGKLVAFYSLREINGEIFVMSDAGGVQTNLTRSLADDANPAWSPNGKLIAFDSDRDGSRDIYVMKPDGTGQTRITRDAADDWWPSWSPDGSRIVFVSDRDGNPEIYAMMADGTAQTRLTNNVSDDLRPVWSPVLSPADQRIAFYSRRDGNLEIYVMNVSGGGQRNLTNRPGDDWHPAWSPDGAHIAFSTVRDGNREVYVMDADGSGQTNTSNNPADDWTPHWGP